MLATHEANANRTERATLKVTRRDRGGCVGPLACAGYDTVTVTERATSWPAHGSRRRRESFLRRRRSCASAMRATTSEARLNASQCAKSCYARHNRHGPPSRPSMLPFVVIAPVELLRLLVLRGARAVRWVFFTSLASENSRWGPAVRRIMIQLYVRTLQKQALTDYC